MRPILTLTTDFGPDSPYVAQMKGVILARCRAADIVDITHAIPPQDTRAGAIVLCDACRWFPEDAIHVAVVDPGVGTARKLIFARWGARRFLAPDNGLLSLLAVERSPDQVVTLENRQFWRESVSATFHGRDILAPVAAHLAQGGLPEELGRRQDALITLAWPLPRLLPDAIEGEILYVDSFGNLVTNIPAELLLRLEDRSRATVSCGRQMIAGSGVAYGHSARGAAVALVGSQGRLEIAIVDGNAARQLGLGTGAAVRVHGSLPAGGEGEPPA
jgi:S-adenosylmethionine hydrolase